MPNQKAPIISNIYLGFSFILAQNLLTTSPNKTFCLIAWVLEIFMICQAKSTLTFRQPGRVYRCAPWTLKNSRFMWVYSYYINIYIYRYYIYIYIYYMYIYIYWYWYCMAQKSLLMAFHGGWKPISFPKRKSLLGFLQQPSESQLWWLKAHTESYIGPPSKPSWFTATMFIRDVYWGCSLPSETVAGALSPRIVVTGNRWDIDIYIYIYTHTHPTYN